MISHLSTARTIRAKLTITGENPTLEEIEYALDHSMLWVHMTRGRHWLCRRNGRTKRWVRDPERFELPLKAGFKTYGTIYLCSEVGIEVGYDFVISDVNPTGGKRR